MMISSKQSHEIRYVAMLSAPLGALQDDLLQNLYPNSTAMTGVVAFLLQHDLIAASAPRPH